MDYKEKYNTALERARKLKEAVINNDTIGFPGQFDEIFPELRESEDERIRKNCIHFLELQKSHHAATYEIDECLAWLEKQKEEEEGYEAIPIESTLEYKAGKHAGFLEGLNEGRKQKESLHIQESCKEDADSFTDEDEKIRKWLYDYISNCPNNNFAFYGGVGKDAVLNYLEKQKEQKPAEWSEEDSKMLDDCIMALSNWRDAVANYGHEVAPCQKLIDWLKSLRPSWKPSAEQMEALSDTLEFMPDTFKPKCTLVTLQNDLKKLKDGTR